MDWRAGLPFLTERTIRRVSTQLEEHRDRWNHYSEIWNSAIASMYIVTSICVSKHTITLIFVVGPMVQQLVVHSCDVGLNLLPWIWSRTSLAFHQSLLYLIPGNANGLGKSTFIDISLPTTFPGSCRALNYFDSRLCRLTHVMPFPACAYWQGPEFRFFPPIRLPLLNYHVLFSLV